MATRTWSNAARGPAAEIEPASIRTWANAPGGGIVEEQAVAAVANRLLLINPPGLDGGFGTGLSL